MWRKIDFPWGNFVASANDKLDECSSELREQRVAGNGDIINKP